MADRPRTNPSLWKGLNLPFGRKRNARRPGPVLALDVDGQFLRAAQTAPRGNQAMVTRVATAQLSLSSEAERTDPAAVGTAMATALENLRLKPVQVVMGVPRHLVVLRALALPMIEDVRELASMVHLQIGKDLPFRQEDAIIDFNVRRPTAPPPRSGSDDQPDTNAPAGQKAAAEAPAKIDVLVAIIRRETLEFYEKAAAAAKLKLIALGWLSQANARCVEACALAKADEVVALVSLRPDEVGIDVVAQGTLLFSRGASVQVETESATDEAPAEAGAESAAEPPASRPATYVEAATIEVVRSLHSYGGMESQAPVAKLIVTGATGQEQVVLESLRSRLQLPGCVLDLAAALDLPEAAREHAADAVGAIGLGLSVNDPEGLPFDFLRPKRPAVQRNMRRIRTLGLCAAGAALLIALFGIRSHLVHERMKIKNAVDQDYKQAAAKLATYRRLKVQAATLQQWTKGGRNWLEHLAYLSAVLPGCEQLYITSLSVSGQGNIHLAVQARSGEILAQLDRQLRAAGYEVKPLAISPGNDRFGYNFRSTVELVVPANMKIDLSKVQPPARPADDASLEGNRSRPGRRGGRS
jgi:Tfp pilus assembly PilM family ATPase